MMACDELWDEEARSELFGRLEPRLRQEGALVDLSITLSSGAAGLVREGRFAEATVLYAESQELSAAYGLRSEVPWILLYAWQGRARQTRALAALMRGQQSLGLWTSFAGPLPGDPGARPAGLRGRSRPAHRDLRRRHPGLLDHVPARPGRGRRAVGRRRRRAARAGPADRAGSGGVDAVGGRAAGPVAGAARRRRRGRATCSPPRSRCCSTTHVATDVARCHLLYGEWLRRCRPTRRRPGPAAPGARDVRGDGRGRVRRARPFGAAGHRRARTSAPAHEPGDATLTPQESRIAGLAAQGMTNSEIASSLFVTASTVEFHMTKILRKTGATSRRELRTLGWRALTGVFPGRGRIGRRGPVDAWTRS